jgi:hypothetical protein
LEPVSPNPAVRVKGGGSARGVSETYASVGQRFLVRRAPRVCGWVTSDPWVSGDTGSWTGRNPNQGGLYAAGGNGCEGVPCLPKKRFRTNSAIEDDGPDVASTAFHHQVGIRIAQPLW